MKAAHGIAILVVALTMMSARAQPAPHDAIPYPGLQDTPLRPETPAMTVDERKGLKKMAQV